MLEQASTLEPDNIDFYVRLGDLYKQEDDYQNAVKNYWEAIDVCRTVASCTDDPAVHRNLEEIFVQLAAKAKEKQGQLNQGRSVAKSSGQP